MELDQAELCPESRIKRGTSLQVHAHLKESKAKGWSLSKRLHPTSRQLCKLSLGLTAQGILLPGGTQETVMKVCQNGKSHFVSKLFGILTNFPSLPSRNRCWFVKQLSQINWVCFSFQSLSSVRSGCVQFPGLPLSGEHHSCQRWWFTLAAPARCYHVSMPWGGGISTDSCQPVPVACHRQWGQGSRLEWSSPGCDKRHGTIL